MRFRALTVLMVGAAAFTPAIAFGPAASAHTARLAAPASPVYRWAVLATPRRPNDVLYTQQDNDTSQAVLSQNFEFDSLDNSGADDFTVPKKHSWSITQVDVTGQYFNGSGPCRDETVTFNKDSSGVPGTVIATTEVAGTDLGGSFQIPVHVSIKAKRKAKRVWVGVVCNMDYQVGGEWGWEVRSVQSGTYQAQWENPGGGFGVGCTTWSPMETCVRAAGPDFMFAIEGTQG